MTSLHFKIRQRLDTVEEVKQAVTVEEVRLTKLTRRRHLELSIKVQDCRFSSSCVDVPRMACILTLHFKIRLKIVTVEEVRLTELTDRKYVGPLIKVWRCGQLKPAF